MKDVFLISGFLLFCVSVCGQKIQSANESYFLQNSNNAFYSPGKVYNRLGVELLRFEIAAPQVVIKDRNEIQPEVKFSFTMEIADVDKKVYELGGQRNPFGVMTLSIKTGEKLIRTIELSGCRFSDFMLQNQEKKSFVTFNCLCERILVRD